jgi:SAM-dependent methyltransferase
MKMDLEEARKFWAVAQKFPADKEAVYPGHAEAHGFDTCLGKHVLEYGCGGGSDTCSMLRRGARVFFVDIVPGNVAVTRKRCHEMAAQHRTHLHEFDLLGAVLERSDSIPLHDNAVDRVSCHGVLHHIPEETMHRVIDEFHRVLRPGGEVFAMLYTEKLFERCKPTIDSLHAQGWAIDRAFSYMTDGGGIARAYTLEAGCELFEQHGFDFVSAAEYNNGDFRTFRVKRC